MSLYRKADPEGGSSLATREIAALDFLLGIPLEAELEIVRAGVQAERDAENSIVGHDTSSNIQLGDSHEVNGPQGRRIYDPPIGGSGKAGGWWESMIKNDSRLLSVEDERVKRRKRLELETGVLERPDDSSGKEIVQKEFLDRPSNFIPGRSLDGHEATLVRIPRDAAQIQLKTRHRTVAIKAAQKDWEHEMTRPSPNTNKQGLLDGRIFFSGSSSYPVCVFSVIKYDPKNEEEFQRRQKLEASGGGGSQFVLPSRDWRGVSYRMLLPRRERKNKAFNQMLTKSKEGVIRRGKQRRGSKDGDESRGGYSGDHDLNTSVDELKNVSLRKHSNINDNESNDDEVLSFNKSMERSRESQEENQSDPNDDDLSSSSSEDSITYEPGFLDDPEMVQGKHRTIMVGDNVTGCVASSIIHYVHPADLKADLNKQFRQRFDQWEPPKSQRKYIGASVIDGTYKLVDPTEIKIDEDIDERETDEGGRRRKRGNSTAEYESIRMPPSLTLSKIRSVKQAALVACVRAKLEVSTVALACVYFERLALDCCVDKSNRRLTFAACLLIALKINESNVKIVHEESNKETKKGALKSWIRPRNDNDFFSSLFTFFTHEWHLQLKTIFAAEWGVFAALGFKLHASPSEVSFHFKRLMKSLEWSPLDYLGREMFDYWQDALVNESIQAKERAKRRVRRRKQREKKILQLQRELEEKEKSDFIHHRRSIPIEMKSTEGSPKPRRKAALKIFNRIGLKKTSLDLHNMSLHENNHEDKVDIEPSKMHRSSSTPNFPLHQIMSKIEEPSKKVT